jgi:hypothetical protein
MLVTGSSTEIPRTTAFARWLIVILATPVINHDRSRRRNWQMIGSALSALVPAW